MAQLLHRWQQLWLLALDRQYRLQTALQRLREVRPSPHAGVWMRRGMLPRPRLLRARGSRGAQAGG